MFFRNLKLKRSVTLRVILVDVHLPVRLGHRDAETVFIAPLAQQLAAAGLGTVTGFAPRQQDEDGLNGLDIHLGLTNASRSALETVARMLDYLSAPCGSSIRVTDTPGDPVLFGTKEGLVLSVDSGTAPDAKARKDLALACRAAIEDHAVSRGWARKENRTLFYFYGENFREMKERLADALSGDPRFQGAILRRLA